MQPNPDEIITCKAVMGELPVSNVKKPPNFNPNVQAIMGRINKSILEFL